MSDGALETVTRFVQAVSPSEQHPVWDALETLEAVLGDDECANREELKEIDRLRAALAERDARIAELREALRPFAEMLPGAAFIEPGNQYVTNARRIYAATGAGEGE